MTYYESSAGAKVFAAGAFTLAGAIRQRPVARLVSNLLDRLGREQARTPSRFLSATGYGWPVKPFRTQHPVRGFFGDPRIGGHNGAERQFHFGVDISAPNGTPVYATITGTVSRIGRQGEALSIDAIQVSACFLFRHVGIRLPCELAPVSLDTILSEEKPR
jgi:murein DD-endopeptidase MepM/ murein hydrolase activator NlpD